MPEKIDMATGASVREQPRMSSACIATLNIVEIVPSSMQQASIVGVKAAAGRKTSRAMKSPMTPLRSTRQRCRP